MNWSEYIIYFNEVLEGKISTTPYDDPHFMEYTKLNISRMNRWLKQGFLNEELVAKLKGISTPQNWVLITEPWCGDAAHIVPFVYLLSEVNPLITLEIQLRDTDSEIEKYRFKNIEDILIYDQQYCVNIYDIFNETVNDKIPKNFIDRIKTIYDKESILKKVTDIKKIIQPVIEESIEVAVTEPLAYTIKL